MTAWKRFGYKVRHLIWRERAEKDLDREIESHLEFLRDDFRRQGMNEVEARLAAKRAYGGIEQAKELHREERSWLWLEHWRQDLRLSARALLRTPAFSVAVVLTLALGIGANAAIFSLIDAVMLKSLPVSHPGELVQVNMAKRDIWGTAGPFVSNPVWEQLRDRQDVFSAAFGYAVMRFDLARGGQSRYVQGNYVSGEFFQTLGLSPVVGRTITVSDDRRGCPGTAVLSYGFWQSEYGGNPDVAGTTVSLFNHSFQILGVLAPGFTGVDVGRKSDIYVPLCANQIIAGENGLLDGRRGGWLRVIGRPKPGLSIDQVRARLKTLARPIMEATIPEDVRPSQQKIYVQRTFDAQKAQTGLSNIRTKYREALTVLMAIVGLLLLIACSNVANLLLARGAARQKEIAIRLALGSGRSRLIGHLLGESLLLSFLGALLGLAFAQLGSRTLVGFLTSSVYRESQVFLDLSVDWRVLTFTLALSVLANLLFALAPAVRATRVDPQWTMKANARGTCQGGKSTLGKMLVVIQVALSLVLVACAGLLLATFIKLETVDLGFKPQQVLLMQVDLGKNVPAQRDVAFQQMLQHLRALPGVQSAGSSDNTPLDGSVGASYIYIDGDTAVKERQLIFFSRVSARYFETLGTRVLAGRDFNAHDNASSPKVAIVTQAFAKKYFAGRDPIGQRYRTDEGRGKIGDPVEIVGVASDTKYLDLREDYHPIVYVASSQSSSFGRVITFAMRFNGSAAALTQAATRAAGTVDAEASLEFRTLTAQVEQSLARERLLALLSGFFGGLALLLAVIGLYGVTSYSVARRQTEIGIRVALGAQQSQVLRSVLGEVMILTGSGLAMGLVVTGGTTRLIASLLYGVKPNDAWMLAGTAGLLALSALLAGLIPARRASRLDPMDALREE